MSEKQFAIAGVVVIVLASVICLTLGPENPAVTQVVSLVTVGLGIVVTLYRLGINTEKTEETSRNVNGILDERIRSTSASAFQQGKMAGLAEAFERQGKSAGEQKPPGQV